ncbi:pentapeptide repeat-containing protein, partial [Enterococcus gallinarum]
SLNQANLTQTNLSKIDFSSCEFDTIDLNSEDIQGCRFNHFQVLYLAKKFLKVQIS